MFIFNYHSSCLHTYKCVDVDASFTVLHIVGLGCVSSSVSALATNAYIMKQWSKGIGVDIGLWTIENSLQNEINHGQKRILQYSMKEMASSPHVYIPS